MSKNLHTENTEIFTVCVKNDIFVFSRMPCCEVWPEDAYVSAY